MFYPVYGAIRGMPMENSLTQVGGYKAQTPLMSEALRIFSILSPQEQRSLLSSLSQLADTTEVDKYANNVIDLLTDREKQVLALLAHGYTRREIGGSLGISANTSARHIANIYRKLDISTAAEAVRVALEAGYIR